MGVPVHQLEVPGQLLDAVDLAPPLDLDRDVLTDLVASQDVDGPDRRHVLAPDQAPPLTKGVDVLGQQLLKVRLDAVLDQAGVNPEIVVRVVEDLVQAYPQPVLRLGVLHHPHQRDPVVGLLGRRCHLGHRAGRGHPVQRLVGAAVAVHEDGTVGLDHEQAGRQRQVCGQSTVVVDAAPGDDETHRGSLSHPGGSLSTVSRRSGPRAAAGRPSCWVGRDGGDGARGPRPLAWGSSHGVAGGRLEVGADRLWARTHARRTRA